MAAVAVLALLAGCALTPPGLQSGPPEPWQPVAAVAVDPLDAYVDARLAQMTLEQKIASLLMIHVPGTSATPLRREIDRTRVAGVILMGDNVADVDQVAALTSVLSADPDLPVLVGIDQEGGIVRRLPGDDALAASDLRGMAASATQDAFTRRGALVAAAGVTVNFGIVADVTADRGSFIFSRTLGDDATSAAARVAAAVAGESGQVLSTLKHFPGHGSVAGDSHSSVPTTGMSLDAWRATQAPPFQAGIDAGAEFVMLGHLRYAAVDDAPATLSPAWHRILREDLGFDGIIVTDDMGMLERSGEAAYADQISNAVRAIAAGTTLLLYVGPVDVAGIVRAVARAVRAGKIPLEVIDDAARRLLELRRELSGREGPFRYCDDACRDLAG